MKVQVLLSLVVMGLSMASSFADSLYICKSTYIPSGSTEDSLNTSLQYRIRFEVGWFSGAHVTVSARNVEENWEAAIVKGFPITATSAGPKNFGGRDYSNSRFLEVGANSDAVFGEGDSFLVGEDLVQRKNSGLVLYEHSMANASGYDASYYSMACELSH